MASYNIKRTKPKDLIELYDKQAFTWLLDASIPLKVCAEQSMEVLEQVYGARLRNNVRLYMTDAKVFNDYYELPEGYPGEVLFCSICPEDLSDEDFFTEEIGLAEKYPMYRFNDIVDEDIDNGGAGYGCLAGGRGLNPLTAAHLRSMRDNRKKNELASLQEGVFGGGSRMKDAKDMKDILESY